MLEEIGNLLGLRFPGAWGLKSRGSKPGACPKIIDVHVDVATLASIYIYSYFCKWHPVYMNTSAHFVERNYATYACGIRHTHTQSYIIYRISCT